MGALWCPPKCTRHRSCAAAYYDADEDGAAAAAAVADDDDVAVVVRLTSSVQLETRCLHILYTFVCIPHSLIETVGEIHTAFYTQVHTPPYVVRVFSDV